MRQSKYNVSIIQMDIALGNPERNRKIAFSLINEAARRGSDVVVLPELWTTGYSLGNIHRLAERTNGITTTRLLDICSRQNIYIVGSIAEKVEETVYNSATILGPSGLVGIYRKTHLFRPMNEHKHFTPGSSFDVFQTNIGRIGVIICYDLRFPELARKAALNGAHTLFVLAEWPQSRIMLWQYLLRARAIENQLFVVASNRIGSDGKNIFGGHSMILDPTGAMLVEAGDSELILTCKLNLNLIDETRSYIPCLEDRNPKVY